jgi:hypothetical protein
MRGEISTARPSLRHPYDWCVDESWVGWQLFRALGEFRQEREAGEAIWDPSIGSGRTMATFVDAGFRVFDSDIVNRIDPDQFDGVLPEFFSADFRECEQAPAPCSIVGNPPYSYIPRIAEAFVRKALTLATRRVCMVLPLKWQASQERYPLFAEDFPPQAILVLTQRPSMPPGDRIPALEAAGRAFKGATVDYGWYIWNEREPTLPQQTRIVWLPTLAEPEKLLPIEGIA